MVLSHQARGKEKKKNLNPAIFELATILTMSHQTGSAKSAHKTVCK